MSSNYGCRCALLVGVLVAGASHAGEVSPAVTVPGGGFDEIFAAGGTTHGWRFTVDEPIRVIALGMYDKQGNGLQIAHPVGLWDEEGGLLRSVVLGAGSGAPLIDRFRYAETPSIVLSPGQWYTVGVYSDAFALNDGMIVDDGDFAINEIIHYEGFSRTDATDGLHIPLTPNAGSFQHRFGANFRFEVVPAPGAIALLGFGGFALSRRRRG